MTTQTDRATLIADMRHYLDNYMPGHVSELIDSAINMLEADAVPPGYGWLTACDEEMICYHLGVANLSDSYESAKRKLRALIDLNVAIATDPAVNGGMSLQPAVPQEPVAYLAYDEDGTYVDLKENKVLRYCSPGTVAIPLYTAQQRPRLTDAEIKAIEHETDMKSSIGDWSNYFARAIEAKVRGEA